MVIEKIINNNIISSKDKTGKELVLMGKGIGFGTYSGACIDENKIEKIFRIEDKSNAERLKQLFSGIPFQYAEIASDVIAYASDKIKVKLSENIYVTLTEHLSFVFRRYECGIRLDNPLLWEIKRFYPLEFDIGKYAIRLIEERNHIVFTEDEAGFIALHFVNSEYGTDLQEAGKFPIYIKNIMNIIQNDTHLQLDESSMNYERMMTHVKFLIQRVLQNELNDETDNCIVQAVKNQYGNEYMCSLRISEYIKGETGIALPKAEIAFMAIHVHHMLKV